MNKVRLAILGNPIVAGGAASMMVGGSPPPPTPETKVIVQQTPMDGVLVASRNIDVGTRIQSGDLRWTEWPRESIAGELIRRSNRQGARGAHRAVARSQFFAGEPIRRERLVLGQRSGFLAAPCRPASGQSRSPSIRAARRRRAASSFPTSRRRDQHDPRCDGRRRQFREPDDLSNVRVLAIGQSIQERNGERTVTGGNATLEVDPGQAESPVLAQRLGQLSLSLRSIMDQGKTEISDEGAASSSDTAITIVRFGNAASAGRR